MGWLDNQVILVTGGGSGLGLAVVRRCVAEGADVAVVEVVPKKVDRLREEFQDSVLVLQGDVTSAESIWACHEAIVSRYRKLNALIGTQGVWDWNAHLEDLTLDEIDEAFVEIFDVNVKGYLVTARIFADLLRQEEGCIVMTLSNAAFLPDGGGPLYTASKHAIVGVVRQLAFEFAPLIRVNGIAPTGIKGSDLRGLRSLNQDQRSQADLDEVAFSNFIESIVPLKRYSSAEDYTSLYVLLASSAHSSVMTGQVLVADQGLYVRGLTTENRTGELPIGQWEGDVVR